MGGREEGLGGGMVCECVSAMGAMTGMRCVSTSVSEMERLAPHLLYVLTNATQYSMGVHIGSY